LLDQYHSTEIAPSAFTGMRLIILLTAMHADNVNETKVSNDNPNLLQQNKTVKTGCVLSVFLHQQKPELS
jgi:hypothetical protein